MPVQIVIDRDDAFRPRGWVAAALPGPEYAPLHGSPARGIGCALSRAGTNGQPRAASIDAGAAQVSAARQPAAAPRLAHEIRRKP